MTYDVSIIVGMGFIAGIFAFLAMKLSDEHDALKLFFLMLSLGTLAQLSRIAGLFSSGSVAVLMAQNTGVMTWVVYVSIVYFFIVLLWSLLKGFGSLAK